MGGDKETPMTDTLTREFGLANYTTPTGRKLGVVTEEYNPALLKIVYTDSKPGDLPDNLKGYYTRRHLAHDALMKYITAFWDMSDEAAHASRKKAS
jgi:hypothetical protein